MRTPGDMTVRIDRRRFIAGTATALTMAAGGLAAPRIARAQTLTTGAAEVTVLSDGHLTLPMGFAFPDVPQDELVALLAANGMPADALRPDCNVTIVKSGDRLAIFDVGAGANFMPTAGKLADSLADAGIDPAAVTDVVFTHAHPDHLWGLTDDFDELVFANAAYHIGQAEWDFWSSPDALSNVPEERQTFVVGAQNRFAVLEDRIAFISGGDEVLPGVEAVATHGHTPGHMSFMVHGAEPLLIVGDAITNSVISLAHPDWPTGSDQDPQQGAATRAALLDRLASDRARVIGYHFPHPGAGHVDRADGAYAYVPA